VIDRRRTWTFAALCLVAVAGTVWYGWTAVRRNVSGTALGDGRGPDGDGARLSVPPARPYLLVRSTGPGDTARRLVLVPLATPAGAGYVTSLTCERAYYAAGRGICLVEETEGLTIKYYADVFDDRFVRLHRLPLTGLPSRTRVAPDGRLAAITVFETGHSYAETGFSTKTTIVDTMTGQMLSDLESFAITRDGQPFRAVDFNFWGVTFMQDSRRFYATLASGGVKYLVEGDAVARTATVVRTGIECPSLSPDNTRIAYKHLLRPDGFWQLRVHDMRTGADIVLAKEERSVDDQVEWADDDRVLYHITGERGADIWSLRADGTEPPALVRQYAYGPAVVR
jgi:hypothetical protein